MDVLLLDEWLPSMRDSGKSIRTWELLAPLAKKHRITYLAHVDGSTQSENVKKMEAAGFEVVCVPRRYVYGSIPAVLFGAIPALFDRLPISVRRHFSPDYAAAVRKLIAEKNFDLVHVEWSHYGVYLPFVGRLPTFICTHNVEFLSWKRFAKATWNPVRKLLGIHEATKLYRFEKETYRRANGISVVSEDDARLVRDEFGIDKVFVIPNGVDIAAYDEVPNTPKPNRLVYCGAMDVFINQDAVAYFLKEIFPLILRQKPETTLTVIGRNPPPRLLALQNERIRFTGAVADVRPSLKEGAVAVVPLRIAGGSRLKILEAFAAKIPVLSTTIGAEGLNVQDGRNILLADTPQDFVERCLHLLDDIVLRNFLAAEGRKVVDEQYDWSRISPLLHTAWMRTAIGTGTGTGTTGPGSPQ